MRLAAVAMPRDQMNGDGVRVNTVTSTMYRGSFVDDEPHGEGVLVTDASTVSKLFVPLSAVLAHTDFVLRDCRSSCFGVRFFPQYMVRGILKRPGFSAAAALF